MKWNKTILYEIKNIQLLSFSNALEMELKPIIFCVSLNKCQFLLLKY